ncbi:DnaJ C-terminal domain-containing protein [Roseomonas elaeocarpi]|uniref:DnaJ C-terminal domain-containing protein n=1 Tax=Roseomonas elaeocarpi TaxID=907779 RepID=A0ABV6JU47_9PROT
MASNDPYQTLGVSRTASADEIRQAFRAIAKKNHPDLNPGNREAEERFKAANAANDLLSDPDKRARFDRGEIDAEGQERPERSYYRDYAAGAGGARYRPGAAGAGSRGNRAGGSEAGGFAGFSDFDSGDFGDIFSDFLRTHTGAGGGTTRARRGADHQYRMEVSFLDAVNGATRRLTLPEGGELDVRIPPGLEDGQILRLRGKGEPGRNDVPAGDALIEVTMLPHPFFQRDGRNLALELPVTFSEAVLGARVPVPTPRGEVSLTIPPHSDSGTKLRLRGRGVAAGSGAEAGDLTVTLRLVTGPVDGALEEFLRSWQLKQPPFDPRGNLGGEPG